MNKFDSTGTFFVNLGKEYFVVKSCVTLLLSPTHFFLKEIPVICIPVLIAAHLCALLFVAALLNGMPPRLRTAQRERLFLINKCELEDNDVPRMFAQNLSLMRFSQIKFSNCH